MKRDWYVVLAACVAVVLIAIFPKWTVDDAFITYRYAENLALHGELTWNVGEDPVEGYTGVLLPVLLAALMELGLSPDLASKSLGVAAHLLGGLMLVGLLGAFEVRASVRSVFAVLYYGAPFLVTHALSGLETSLFSLLVISSLFSLARVLEAPGPSPGRESAMLGLLLIAALARPEGAVLAALSVLTAGTVASRRDRSSLPGFALRALILLVLPGLLYFAWRSSYYGQLLPNTYYAKWTRRLSLDTLESLARFGAIYLALPLVSGATLLGGVAFASRRADLRELRERWSALLPLAVGLAFVVVCSIQYTRSYLVMNYSFRFFVPFYPILLATAAVAIDRGLVLLRGHGRSGRRLFAVRAALGGALLLQLAIYAWVLPREIAFASATRQLLRDAHIRAGHYLREHVPADEWLVVVVDAGAIPYHAKLKTIDFGGLNDEFLAHRWRRKIPAQAILDYFFARKPGAIVFTSTQPDRVDGPEPIPLTEDPRFRDYVLARSFESPGWERYYELVYLRRDLYESLPERVAHFE